MFDILQPLLAHFLKGMVKAIPYLFANCTRDRDAARVSDTLQPCRDVYAIAIDVVAFNDNISKVDADAELETAHVRLFVVPRPHVALHFHGTGDGADHAGKLQQHSISGQLYDSSLVTSDVVADELISHFLQSVKRIRFVRTHESAV